MEVLALLATSLLVCGSFLGIFLHWFPLLLYWLVSGYERVHSSLSMEEISTVFALSAARYDFALLGMNSVRLIPLEEDWLERAEPELLTDSTLPSRGENPLNSLCSFRREVLSLRGESFSALGERLSEDLGESTFPNRES